MKRSRRVALATAGLLASVIALSSCSSDGYTDNSMRSVRYEKGSLSGGKFVECVAPGKKIVTNDRLYAYPVTQREDVWDSDEYHRGSSAADQPDLVLTDRDGNDLHYKIKVPFTLNTSCDPVTVNGKRYPGGTLQVFHELISKTRHGYFGSDGSYGGENSGWIWLMKNHISSSVRDLMNQETRTTTVDAVWRGQTQQNKFDNLTAVKDYLQENLQKAVDDSTETDLQFYKIGTIKIYGADPDADYAQIFRDRQKTQLEAQTSQDNAKAKILQAKADTRTAKADAKVLQAKIHAAGGPKWYWCGQALDAGKDCFVPNGVLVNSNR